MMDVNYTYCGDHCVIYTSIKLLHCTPETSIMLCQLYLSKKIISRKNFKNYIAIIIRKPQLKIPLFSSHHLFCIDFS